MGIFDRNKTSQPQKQVLRAEIVGMRTGVESKTFSNVNFSIYAVLVEYTDGSRALKELQTGSPELRELLMYITMK